jgi:glutamate synthase (NADPH/NADH) large chain
VSDERDACALVSIARKDGQPTREVLDGVLRGMAALAHRSGLVDGEGDGAGVLTDIPRALWASVLRGSGYESGLVRSGRFAVGHLFIPPSDGDADQAAVRRSLARRGIEILVERTSTTDSTVLGPRGRTEEPRFWQLALFTPSRDGPGSRALYEAAVEIERLTAATVVSLSRHSAVYKLRGAGDQLPRYFADLGDPRFATSMAFGHNRYATNTSTSFDRVQPFASFAHNGEINTIGGCAKRRRRCAFRYLAPAATRRMSTRSCGAWSSACGSRRSRRSSFCSRRS